MHTHTVLGTHSSWSESLSYCVSHNSLRQCIIKEHPPPPLISTLSPALHPLLLSTCFPPALAVTEQLRPANPF